MKIKTTELTGLALNWAAAIAMFPSLVSSPPGYIARYLCKLSTDWEQAGPMLQDLKPEISWNPAGDLCQVRIFVRSSTTPFVQGRGPTMLIAAARCLVASKLGDEVEIPDELIAELLETA